MTHGRRRIHRDEPMGKFGEFQSSEHENRFREASHAGRIGSAARPICGVLTRTGRPCQHVPLEDGKGRCLRHCGPDAARAYRQRQLRQMQTGKTGPAEFARSEARRQRNALQWAWRKNPSLPGRTIDLQAHEGPFRDAAFALGVDVARLYPAQADWLRWRFQRTQIDRTADAPWVRAVRDDLPKQIADADTAMVWVRLGSLDKRTKTGRAVKAALRAGGEDHAQAVKEALEGAKGRSAHQYVVRGPESATMPVSGAPVRPWVAPVGAAGVKRPLPDRAKAAKPAKQQAPRQRGRPKKGLESMDETAALMRTYQDASPVVKRMYQAISDEGERFGFLRSLKAVSDAPDDVSAQTRWGEWVRHLRQIC